MPLQRAVPDLLRSSKSSTSSEDSSFCHDDDKALLPFDLRSLDLQDLITATTAAAAALSAVANEEDHLEARSEGKKLISIAGFL